MAWHSSKYLCVRRGGLKATRVKSHNSLVEKSSTSKLEITSLFCSFYDTNFSVQLGRPLRWSFWNSPQEKENLHLKLIADIEKKIIFGLVSSCITLQNCVHLFINICSLCLKTFKKLSSSVWVGRLSEWSQTPLGHKVSVWLFTPHQIKLSA